TMRLATVDDMAVNVVPPIVAAYREKHPNVTVVVDVRQSFVDLAKHEADVALRFGQKPPEGDVLARRVLFADIGLFASRSYLKKHGRPKTPEELYDHALVRAAEEHLRLPFERTLVARSLNREPVARNGPLRFWLKMGRWPASMLIFA